MINTTINVLLVDDSPIIICSATTDTKEVATTFRVMEAGALGGATHVLPACEIAGALLAFVSRRNGTRENQL